MFRGIDFFSDTVTRPSKEMRLFMANAEVGDEQLEEDPTTKALEKKVAALLGTESAVFFPTASMANEVALRAMSRPGDELVCYEHCHLCFAETGGPAIHSGLMIRPIRSEDGTFSGADVRQMFRDQRFGLMRLVWRAIFCDGVVREGPMHANNFQMILPAHTLFCGSSAL
jgi:threonine aldolase